MSDELTQLVIEGVTEDGRAFRPSDWTERLLDSLSHYGSDRRARPRQHNGPERRAGQIRFLQAQICDGNKCLVVDLRLRDANPQAYDFLMEFVRNNRLRWRTLKGAAPE
jgi:hypothetical protein